MSSPDDDIDDRTLIRPAARPAPVQLGHVLPTGTRLRDYEISGLIGEGGFGIVYLAWDHSLQRKVAVKEYMPASMASRLNGSSAIVVKSDRHVDAFKAGLRSFVNEARLLARFDHPSLVKVYRFWEENGTAYMVMPFYEGPTLKTALAELGHVPSEAELRAWLRPLLDALAVMHAAQCYHRDIAPDNILLTPAGPLLLDFGAARRVIGDMTHALTVVLKPGYAPIEQYGDVATMAQGAWTDLYALACVVYYAITGKTPVSSVERLMDDRLEPLAVVAAGRYSGAFLNAIDLALAVRPQDRPQNERQFRALLDADLPFDATSSITPSRPPERAAFEKTQGQSEVTVPGTLSAELRTQLITQRMPRPAAEVIEPTAADRPVTPLEAAPAPQVLPAWTPPPTTAAPTSSVPQAPPGRARRPIGWWLLGVALLAIVAAALLWTLRAPEGAKPAAQPAASAAAAASAASVAASAPTLPITLPAPQPSAASSTTLPQTDGEANAVPVTPAAPAAAPPGPVQTPITAAPPPRTHRESRPDSSARNEPPAVVRRAAPRAAGPRCSDILQKGSLEPLTAEEAAYLRRECR